ncbi:hypothetical protein BD289DRAFT_481301, partial [Coniella lustricola]
FQVEHHRRGWSERTAWASIRLDRLQEGYRLIKLKTDDGYKSDGMLLVKIEKKLSDEDPPLSSSSLPAPLLLPRKTWRLCREEVSQIRSRWSCLS